MDQQERALREQTEAIQAADILIQMSKEYENEEEGKKWDWKALNISRVGVLNFLAHPTQLGLSDQGLSKPRAKEPGTERSKDPGDKRLSEKRAVQCYTLLLFVYLKHR